MGLLTILFKANHPVLVWLNHRHLYLLGIATIVCGLGWSNVLMSIGQFIIIGNWIIEFDFRRKLNDFKKNKLIAISLLLFFIHVVALLWTKDFSYALKDITIKLPLLAFPVIIGTTKKLELKEWKLILSVYTITLLLLTVASLGKYLGYWGGEITDKRQLSNYISHIRYGLNLAFACILLFWFHPFSNTTLNKFIAIWFFFCLVLFELYTGIIVLLTALILISVLRNKVVFNSNFKRIALPLGIFILLTYIGYQSYLVYTDFKAPVQLTFDQNDKTKQFSVNGEKYKRIWEDTRQENGVYIERFIARKEIEREWNKVSKMPYLGEDKQPTAVANRLLRYLSSKGLKKDSLAFSKLSETEIRAIENGVANVYYLNHSPWQNRLHKTFYEIEEYKRHGNASGYSVVMRYVYWKTAISIIKKNLIFGVGTGDIKNAFAEEYRLTKSKLDIQFQKRTHNQFLTFVVVFGIFGLPLILFSIYYPISKAENKKLAIVFIFIMSLSFISEDTLETQAGVTLYAGLYSLIVFGLKQNQPITSR